jgi:hypothetical protein
VYKSGVSDESPKAPDDKRTLRARREAHEVFDRIWKNPNDGLSKNQARRKAYKWLRKRMGLSRSQGHISQLTQSQCEALIKFVYEDHPHLHNGFTRLLYGPFDAAGL